jgi:DNA polymerase-4
MTFQTLSRIGIRTIQTLSEMPAEVLQRMIGKMELRFGKANGIDNNPVEPYTERKSIATEHTFVQDTLIWRISSNFMWYGRKIGFSIAV